MKRLFLFLLMALFLTGCTVEQPPETTQTTPVQTEPPGLYEPENRIEKETGGAVRVYPLKNSTYSQLYSMGNHLLLVADGEMMTLTGDKGVPAATLLTGSDILISGIDTAVTGMGYYLPDTRQVVILSPQLQTVSELVMPEEMAGEPVISMAQNQIFYATDTQIRAVDMKTGISRLVRTQSAPGQIELQCHFDGTVLACRFTDAEGQSRTEYISSQTGQSYTEERRVYGLQSEQERYFAHYTDGVEDHLIFGSKEGGAQVIQIPQTADALQTGETAMLAMNGLLSFAETETGITVSFFDFEEGKQIAQTTLSGLQAPTSFRCDGTYIWVLAMDGGSGRQVLCRWDITQSAVHDANVYTQPLYTAQNPDTQGLAACREQADRLESRYGVEIAIWTEAEKNAGEYTVVPEHSTQRIEAMLADLDQGLSLFPENFLQETVGGKISISLVRSIEEQEGVQFWKGGDCFLIIPSTDIAQSFFRTIAYAIDSHILGNSRDLDIWNQLNPKGFEYAYSFEIPEQSEYLEGENRAFADRYAMAYPHEDRCRTFACAMLPDNEEIFASAAMQAKLKQLCLGIREAYGLEKSPESYPWEQYLENSLAFTEK